MPAQQRRRAHRYRFLQALRGSARASGLAAARTPDGVEAILGKRRVATYSVIFLLLALGCVAASLYIAIAVAVGAGSVWMLGWLLGPFSLFLFFGSISYGDFYYRVTGSRPQMRTLARVLDVLNRDL